MQIYLALTMDLIDHVKAQHKPFVYRELDFFTIVVPTELLGLSNLHGDDFKSGSLPV